MLALSVAAVLAIFLVYVSLAGGGTPALQPGELNGRTEKVVLTGKVATPAVEIAEWLHGFRLRDMGGTTSVVVMYPGSLPDQFKVGRDISVQGRLRAGVFRGVEGTMITKCPSKYAPKKT